MAIGPTGEAWVAGHTNHYLDWLSCRHADDYVAKIDATGTPVWEMAYRNYSAPRRGVWSITSLSGGDVAVVGRDGWGGRVARIGPDGAQLWEQSLGTDLDGAIAALPGDRLAIVGFESTGSSQNHDFRNHVMLWLLDGSGKTLTETRLRDSINNANHMYFGTVSLVTTDDAIYASSNWEGMFDAHPAEVAKLSVDGMILWMTSLPDTIVEVEGKVRSWDSCTPTLVALPDGRVVVVCALGGQIQLYQIDPHSRKACCPIASPNILQHSSWPSAGMPP